MDDTVCSSAANFKKGDPSRLAANVGEVKEYANLQGLFAVGPEKNSGRVRGEMRAAAQAAAATIAPAYD